MSIDFGNDIYEDPIVAKTFLAEDAQESSLRPKTLSGVHRPGAGPGAALHLHPGRQGPE